MKLTLPLIGFGIFLFASALLGYIFPVWVYASVLLVIIALMFILSKGPSVSGVKISFGFGGLIKAIAVLAGIALVAIIMLGAIGYFIPVSTLNFCSNQEMQRNVQVLSGTWTVSQGADGNCKLVGINGEAALNRFGSIGAITIDPVEFMPNDLTLSIGPRYNFLFQKSVWKNYNCASGDGYYYDASFYYAGMPGNFNGADGCVPNQNGNTPYPLTLKKSVLDERTPIYGTIFGMPRNDPVMEIGERKLRIGDRFEYTTKEPVDGTIRISTKSEVIINDIKLYCPPLSFVCDLQAATNLGH